MGAKMQRIEDGLKTSIMLTEQQVEQLDKIAKRFGLRRAQAHRIVLEAGLEAYSVFENMGMSKLAELVIKTKRAVKKERQMSIL